jgi:hypothetical protein
MRRVLLIPPLALLASACAVPAATPALHVAYAPQPNVAGLDLPARAEALARWQLPPSDTWAAYAKYTLFTALGEGQTRVTWPNPESLEEVQRAIVAGHRLGEYGLPPDTLWIADMRGAASVAFGVALSRSAAESVSVIPTFNNWPAENELVPAEETLAALATMTPRLPEADVATHPLFLLDAWRLAYRDQDPGDETYDNRYMLSPTDLPDVAALRVHGIRRVVYVVESLIDTQVEEDDLHAAFAAYEAAGLQIAMIDLDVLEEPLDPGGWDQRLDEHRLGVPPRVTILQQPGFYARAQGGFGGIHAGPPPVGFGVGWHGGGG